MQVTQEDAGTYICQADNVVSSSTKQAVIHVEEPYEHQEEPDNFVAHRLQQEERRDPQYLAQYQHQYPLHKTPSTTAPNIQPRQNLPEPKDESVTVIAVGGSNIDLNCMPVSDNLVMTGYNDIVWSRPDGLIIANRHKKENGQKTLEYDKDYKINFYWILRFITHL